MVDAIESKKIEDTHEVLGKEQNEKLNLVDISKESPAVASGLQASAVELATGTAGDKTAVSSTLVTRTEHQGKFVALTIDDGPSPKYTPQVLELLKENHINATFCLVGNMAKAYPNLVKDIVADGNKLCDHTMSHDEHLPKRSDAKIKSEILGDKELLQSIVPGAPVDYYRAPGGNWAGHVRQLAASWGMKPLHWSVDTNDWKRPGVKSILGAVDRELKPGGVILMHDGGGDRSQSIAAMKILIPKLENQGYKFDFPA